ncbi:hypothetical protein [Chromobacterium haemolyticum]|uniref:hypothetical protein n=1 Tax=Chromobacterium TaxID=535 RepID=UPI0040575408
MQKIKGVEIAVTEGSVVKTFHNQTVEVDFVAPGIYQSADGPTDLIIRPREVIWVGGNIDSVINAERIAIVRSGETIIDGEYEKSSEVKIEGGVLFKVGR